MSTQGIVGIVALVVGVALLIVGMNASHSVADQVSNTFSGKFTQDTMWYIIGGIGVGVAGLVMLLFGARGRAPRRSGASMVGNSSVAAKGFFGRL